MATYTYTTIAPPRAAGRLRQRLGRRMYAHRARAAGTFRRRGKPVPEPSHRGRLIRRTCCASCSLCYVYLPIACFARWCAWLSEACFDQFSLFFPIKAI
jgi:hypothetical protein